MALGGRARFAGTMKMGLLLFGWVSLGYFLLAPAAATTNGVAALRNAHAHNDYEHSRPLFEALEQSFTSVEADVHWIDGEIRVSHDRAHALPGLTLRKLYLDPLQVLVRTNHGRVHRDRAEFFLMLDYKADEGVAALELHRSVTSELKNYREMLTAFHGTNVTLAAVTVVLSGSRPFAVIARETERWWAIDGKLAELESNPPAALVPWISTSWTPTFTWTGRDEFPADQRDRLRGLVAKSHAQGRLLRFWGAPDHLDFWRGLREEGVDLINTDQLEKLAQFLRTQ